jgi:hypothetical protein
MRFVISAVRLAIGDLIRCSKCRGWHPAEQTASGSATDYAERMLYIRCGGGLFCVGQLGLPARDPRHAQRNAKDAANQPLATRS